jgi:hypothetical protein
MGKSVPELRGANDDEKSKDPPVMFSADQISPCELRHNGHCLDPMNYVPSQESDCIMVVINS